MPNGHDLLLPPPQALNVTLNVLQKHYWDRDLHRSGNSVVMITAGTGVFNVDGGLSGEQGIPSCVAVDFNIYNRTYISFYTENSV